MALIIPNSFASQATPQLADLDDNFTYLKTELDPFVDNIIVDTESGELTVLGGILANITGDVTGNVAGDINGNAATVTNGVYTTGNQTIDGVKTFSSNISGNITGNAGTVTNGVYTTNFTSTNQSLTTSGYQKLPGGLIMQWGQSANVPGQSTITVTYPLAFPTAVFTVTVTPYGSGDISEPFVVRPTPSTTSFVIFNSGNTGGASMWIAMGY